MLPIRLRSLRLMILALVALVSVSVLMSEIPPASAKPAPTLVLDGLGKGAAPLDGPWQFHLGDDASWAAPTLDDSNWEQLTADQPWGVQGHASYTGYAWYRRHVTVSPAPGASPEFALLVPAVDDVYEIFWDGKPIEHLGQMPPHWVWYVAVPARSISTPGRI
jgi:diguanylate cyclase